MDVHVWIMGFGIGIPVRPRYTGREGVDVLLKENKRQEAKYMFLYVLYCFASQSSCPRGDVFMGIYWLVRACWGGIR